MKHDLSELIERASLYYLGPVIKIIGSIRAFLMNHLVPTSAYFKSRSLYPLSAKYGFDRGLPIDRHYIELFLKMNASDIKGKALEIVDNTYLKKFGKDKVRVADALDIFPTKFANIHGDLRNLKGILKDNEYDCLVITQTFNVIDDYESAISECHRILKPGGVLLVTLPTVSPAWNMKINMWRFTKNGCQYQFSQCFGEANVKTYGFGNPVSVQGFWVGMSQQDLTKEELETNDPNFPLIIGIRAIKQL